MSRLENTYRLDRPSLALGSVGLYINNGVILGDGGNPPGRRASYESGKAIREGEETAHFHSENARNSSTY